MIEVKVYFEFDGYEVCTVLEIDSMDTNEEIFSVARSNLVKYGVNLDGSREGEIMYL